MLKENIFNIAYGDTTLRAALPERTRVIRHNTAPLTALPDPAQAVRDALSSPIDHEPLSKLVGPKAKVTIAFDDPIGFAPAQKQPDFRSVAIKVILEELEKLGVWHRFIEKDETVHTADASSATGIPLHRITKNLVSETDTGERVLLVVPGDKKVDLQEAAKALGVHNVKLFPFKEAHRVSGYPPGGTPTLGLRERIRTVIDSETAAMETFFCGGGTRDRLVELRSDEVVRVTGAVVASITR